MAFLSAKEIKSLREVGLAARVMYIFFQKPLADSDGLVEVIDEALQDGLDGVILDADSEPPVLNVPAIELLIEKMVGDQLLSPADVRKIKNLLYLH